MGSKVLFARRKATLPSQDNGTPRQAAANRFGDQKVTFLDLAPFLAHRQSQRNRGGRGVAVVLNRHDNLSIGRFNFLAVP